MSDDALLREGRRVLEIEAASVAALSLRLDGAFVRASRLVAAAAGRMVVFGVGKSGHIARKLASTLTSTGTAAIYLNPVEAQHGDLGVIGRSDVALFVSKSGDLSQVGPLVDFLSRLSVPVIAILGTRDGDLARHAAVVLDASVAEEGCPLDLAPTASTTAALALGDALAMAVLRLKGFKIEDFALLHPGGALGRKLSVRVADVMVSQAYPWLGEDATMKDAIAPLAHMRGTVAIVDARRRLVGVVTAGDLTRLMEREADFLSISVADVMTREPKTAIPNELGSAAASRMEASGIMALPVVGEDGRLVGMLHLHDLMRAGAV